MFASTEDLTSVAIETNDTGPGGADVWWLLFRTGQTACAFPQGATGETVVLKLLMALPEFDQSETIKAMGCTSNSTFIVWRPHAVASTFHPKPDIHANRLIASASFTSRSVTPPASWLVRRKSTRFQTLVNSGW